MHQYEPKYNNGTKKEDKSDDSWEDKAAGWTEKEDIRNFITDIIGFYQKEGMPFQIRSTDGRLYIAHSMESQHLS